MRSSLVSYSHRICLTISWESLLISNLVVASVRAWSSPTRTTSYSFSLLEVEKLRQITCSNSSPGGDCRIGPIPNPDALDASFTWNVHHWPLGGSTGCAGFLGSSTIKSTITCPFNDNLGWYMISYSLNSMTHFNIRLDKFNLCRVTRSGWFVSMVTWWA